MRWLEPASASSWACFRSWSTKLLQHPRELRRRCEQVGELVDHERTTEPQERASRARRRSKVAQSR
jgi:hypothetical protein